MSSPICATAAWLLLFSGGCRTPSQPSEPEVEIADSEVLDTGDSRVEDTGPLPILEAGAAPWEGLGQPARVEVLAVDEDSEPLEDVAIAVRGTVHRSDENGRVVFAGLPSGDASIVAGGVDGWATKARMLWLEEGARLTVELQLVEVGASTEFEAAEGATLEHGGILLEVPADGVTDLHGEPWEGEVVLEMTGYAPDAEELFPGPLLAEDADEGLIGLQTFRSLRSHAGLAGRAPSARRRGQPADRHDLDRPGRGRRGPDVGAGQHGARWFEPRFVEAVYEANDERVALARSHATIYGVAAKWNGSSLAPVDGFQRAWLERAGVEHECPALYGDFSFRDVNTAGDTFACVGVEPTSIEDPWTLYVMDNKGELIEAMTQRIAPVAGGVMVAHN